MKVKILTEIYATIPDELVESNPFQKVEQDIRDLLYVGMEYTDTPIDFIQFNEMHVHLVEQISFDESHS